MQYSTGNKSEIPPPPLTLVTQSSTCSVSTAQAQLFVQEEKQTAPYQTTKQWCSEQQNWFGTEGASCSVRLQSECAPTSTETHSCIKWRQSGPCCRSNAVTSKLSVSYSLSLSHTHTHTHTHTVHYTAACAVLSVKFCVCSCGKNTRGREYKRREK